jgi:WSC domain
MEYSDECWCGDVSDIALNNGVMSPETDCNMLCSGDPYHLCGGQQRLQLYEWAGNISVYSYPTNTGRYEVSNPLKT